METHKTAYQNKEKIILIIIAFFVLLLLVDRFYWAQISQWREDQATNLWLGYTAGIGNMPVGLMSSKAIPNPNGMLVLGFFLSTLPNLLSVSFLLGVIQMAFLILVGWESFGRNWRYLILAILPPLSSVILRSISVEFWNQYTVTLVNIFFVFWAVKYIRDRSLWNIPPIVVLILLAPSMYLAGIVNAIVMALITLGLLIFKHPITKQVWQILSVSLFLVLVSILLTWLPYYQNIELERIVAYNKSNLGPVALLQLAWESLFGFPIYATFQWADKATFSAAFKHSDPKIISSTANILLRVVGRVYMIQAIFAFLTFIYTAITAFFTSNSTTRVSEKVNTPVARTVILSGMFIGLSYIFSIWLGGPNWINNERLDQIVQFLPMFLWIIFLLPHLIITEGTAKKNIKVVSSFSLTLFCATNLLCGFLIIRDHLQYRGNILSEADVPLIDKIHIVDFVATDWKKYSNSKIIPIDYDLGGGRWDEVVGSGNSLLQWYAAPMTLGRSFDYELLRQYGLKNQQDGVQFRTFGTGRYLVTYAFEAPPSIESRDVSHYIFGRLRVSIVEK